MSKSMLDVCKNAIKAAHNAKISMMSHEKRKRKTIWATFDGMNHILSEISL